VEGKKILLRNKTNTAFPGTRAQHPEDLPLLHLKPEVL
jgi:hypothetical protein